MPKHRSASKIPANQTYWAVAITALLLATGCSSNEKPQSNGTNSTALSLYVRGALDHQSQNDDASLQSLQAALQHDPNLIMARFLLGTIYREKGDYESAATQY